MQDVSLICMHLQFELRACNKTIYKMKVFIATHSKFLEHKSQSFDEVTK